MRYQNKGKPTRRIATVICSAVLLTSLLFINSPGIKTEAATTAQKIQEARNKKAETEKQIAQAKENVAALSGEVNELSGELAELAAMTEEQKALYEKVAAELTVALQAEQAAVDEYMISLEILEKTQIEYSKRMGLMMGYADKSPLEILLTSDNLEGFFSQMEMLRIVAEADRQALDQLEAARDDAELKKKIQDEIAAEVRIVADEKREELDLIKAELDITQDAFDQKRAALYDAESWEGDLAGQRESLDDEIANLLTLQAKEEQERRQREAAVQAAARPRPSSNSSPSSSGSGYVPNGMFIWPYPGASAGSAYGNRFHPVYHEWRFHAGEDIGGNYGDRIIAAAAGTVSHVSLPVPGQNTGGSGYGNVVYIDHGNGIQTRYAHCRDVYVSVGQSVSQGQHIADCGSTGTSTGPHLHFEVRVNGSPTNPMSYFN